MRKILTLITTLAIVLWVSDVFAQTEAGTFYMSGSTNIMAAFGSTTQKFEPKDGDETEYDGPKTTAFNVGPSVGFFIFDGFAAGLFLDYTYIKEDQDADEEKGINQYTNTFNELIFGPFLKFYIGQNNVKPFLVGSVGFGNQKTKYEGDVDYMKSDEDEYELKLFNWSAGAGVAFFPAESVSLEFGVAYGSDKYTHESDYGDHHEIDTGIGVRFGISVFLGN